MKRWRLKSTYSLGSQFKILGLWAIIPFVLLTTVSNITFYMTSRRAFADQITSQSESIYRTIRLQVDNSIRAYLRAKVETAIDLMESVEPDVEKLIEIMEILSATEVGSTGYYYIVDGEGAIIFHPDPNFVGTDLAEVTPVREQVERKTGYFEYDWQNTYESSLHAKALYMDYLESMDWIVTATSYRSEFSTMIDIESVRSIIDQSRFGISGYSYIFDRTGQIIAHPLFAGADDVSEVVSPEFYESVIQRLFNQEEGFITYEWRDESGGQSKKKDVYLKYLPEYDWVIGTAVYQSEVIRPFLFLMFLDIGMALLVGVHLVLSIYRFNGDISRQIGRITDALNLGRSGNLSARIMEDGPQELRTVTGQVNFFIESLDKKTRELEELNSTLEERVNERTEELTQASLQLMDAEKRNITSKLVAGIAHEINNPVGVAMTGISLTGEKLADMETLFDSVSSAMDASKREEINLLISDARESIDISFKNLKRAGELVRSFKNVSTDQLSLSRRVFILDSVVNEILLSLSPLLQKRNVALNVSVPPLEIDSYPGVFSHILTNFIQNSMVHGFNVDDEGCITITAKQKNETITFEYQDDGKGIDQKVAHTLFDPFVTTRRSDGSTGLGLSIVKNLVMEKLGGQISASSVPGTSTVFTVEFPVVAPMES